MLRTDQRSGFTFAGVTFEEYLGQATDMDGNFVFDELGLRSKSAEADALGRLITHVIFHPIQKSLNRLIQIDYTVRIQSLSGGNA